MLTDKDLKYLKKQDKAYKVTDRDGMYAYVTSTGVISFRYDYRLNGRRETLVIGKYAADGLSLAAAREKCIDARISVKAGRSPAQERQLEKKRLKDAKSFGQDRALVAWQRILRPDGSSIVIDNLPGTDGAGAAGVADRVNVHTGKLLKGVA